MIRELLPLIDYNGMIELFRRVPNTRTKKINNVHLITHPNQEKWFKFFNHSEWKGYVLLDNSNTIRGLILGAIVENFWDTLRIGKIIAWVVDEEYRGSEALRLLSLMLKWLKENSTSYIITQCDFESNASKIYRLKGFKPLEETLYWRA